MPNGVSIDGQFRNVPGTTGTIVYNQANGITGLTRSLAIVTEAPYLEQGVPTEVFNQPAMQALQPLDINLQRMSQSVYQCAADDRVPSSPSSVILCNVQPNTQAYVNLVDGSGDPSVKLASTAWGSVGNQTLVEVGLSGSTYTIDVSRGGSAESWTAEALNLFSLQYTGTSPTTTIAAGSDTVNVSTFAGAGTLNVASTTGFPTTGTLRVATASGVKVISYTGVGATTFTGCNSSGQTGVMSTGGAVSTNQWTTAQTGNRPYTTLNDTATLPQATITVASTAAFPVEGVLAIETTLGVEEVSYSGKTATTFLGCSGGTGVMAVGNDVKPIDEVQTWVSVSRASLALGGFSPACPWDGKVLLTPSGAPSGETYTAVITGVDATTGDVVTENVTWADTVSTPALSTYEYSTLTSTVFSTSGNDTPTFTVQGDIQRATEAEYDTAGALAIALSAAAYSDALFVVSSVNDLATSVPLSSVDPLAPSSITTAKTFQSAKQAIVDALAPSALVTATALETGGAPVALSQQYMTGGSQGVTASSDWEAALVAMRDVTCSVMTVMSESPTVWALLSTHLGYMAGIGGNPRCGWVGAPRNSTLVAAKAYTAGLNTRNLGLVVDEIQRPNPVTGASEWRTPKWWALQIAAMQCSTDEGLTYKIPQILDSRRSATIPGADVANNPAIAAAITILGRPVNGQSAIVTRILRALTTWRTNNDPARTDVRANQSLNELLNFAYTNMVSLVGQPTTVPLKIVQSTWRSVLQAAIDQGLIAGADIRAATVVRQANVLLFVATIFPAYTQEFFVFRIQVGPNEAGSAIIFQQAA